MSASRPRTTDGLTSWVAIADATGLSERQVKRVYARAMTKVRLACAAAGITHDDLMRYLAARDVTHGLDLPDALIPGDCDLADLHETHDDGDREPVD